MLQRTPHSLVYLSAEELGITECERAGLIEFRDDLARGRIKYARPDMNSGYYEPPVAFNMMHACGTVRCIAGWMQARGIAVGPLHHAMHRLFCPAGSIADWATYNSLQTVAAIDHFLAGAGAECWPMALQDIPVA